MRTSEELDRLHEANCKRFPNGCTREQFVLLTLESADEDGHLNPHSLADWFGQMSWLMWMIMDGLIVHRGGHHVPFNWFITDKGRDWLKAHPHTEAMKMEGR